MEYDIKFTMILEYGEDDYYRHLDMLDENGNSIMVKKGENAVDFEVLRKFIGCFGKIISNRFIYTIFLRDIDLMKNGDKYERIVYDVVEEIPNEQITH